MEPWEEELRGNPEDWVPVKARVSKNPTDVYSIRLRPTELHHICEAARRRGMKTTQFIRWAAVVASNDDTSTSNPALALTKCSRGWQTS